MTPAVQQEFEDDESVHFMDVIFEVEDCVFKVPRRHFEDSEMFSNILQHRITETAEPDGSKDHPFRLEGIGKDDFKQLLKFMDPRQFRDEITLSVPQYTAVLKLSTMWEFEEIRELVIQKTFALQIDDVDKIVIARDYQVSQWLLPPLIGFARRGESITAEDVDRLGLDYFLKIVQERENMVYSKSVKCKMCLVDPYRVDQAEYSNASTRQEHDFTEVLRSAFRDEIKQMEEFNSQATHVSDVGCEDDERFYLVDVIFLIENCFFKGHRQLFEDSPIFRDMFSLPAEKGLAEGSSKEQPLRIEGIKRADFKQLLRFMNARSAQERTFSIPEWTSVLKLSTMWEFEKIRQFAIAEMSRLPINVIDKIALARDYHVPQWLLPSLNEYARRRKSITAEDVDRLSLNYVLKIIQVRERMSRTITRNCPVSCGSSTNYTTETEISSRRNCDFTTALGTAFQREIEASRTRWRVHRTFTTPSVLVTAIDRELPEVPVEPPPAKISRRKTIMRKLLRTSMVG